ncbi:PLD nuclease N-terminal domain-containing protein [Streptomyces atriruber]|uniref:PLD nuclease N-terminal domain-containing protein n=1 Tax=Streptomyces atriruber TaxID=545121 RepID=UPI001ABFBFC8
MLLAATKNEASGVTSVVAICACIGAALLFVGALISIARSRLTGGMKFAWLVFAFVLPFLGSLLWFLFGRRDSLREPRTR